MRLTDKQLLDYRLKLQRLCPYHTISLFNNGTFEVLDIKENEKNSFLMKLRNADFVQYVNASSNGYNFSRFSFNKGYAEPETKYSIRGSLKENLEEASTKKTYHYKGKVYRFQRLLGEVDLETSAISKEQAINFLKFKAAKEFGFDRANGASISIDEYNVKDGPRETRSIIKTKTCKQCGRHLTDSGECPLCNLHDESVLEEDVEKHDTLNPKIWNEDNTLKEDVKQKIEEVVEKFKEQLAEDEVELNISDIYILGSNANYNYNKDSDLDIHIIADETSDCDKEHLPIIYNAYKTIFNDKYDISFNGINVELYVENKDKLSNVATGVYSLKEGWIKEPSVVNIPELDKEEFDKKVRDWEEKFFEIKEDPSIEKIEKYFDDLYDIRLKALADEGEFAIDNLVFKELRSLGYLEDLKEMKDYLISDELSLQESLNEGKEDIISFKNKFGDDLYNNFVKAKERLKNKKLSTDFTYYIKNTSPEELKDLIASLYADKDKDAQKLRQINGETREVRGKYKFFGEIDGYLVYQPLDYIASMDLGINTGWCTTGRYTHAGHPEFTPSADDAKKHFDSYTDLGVTFYYFLNPQTFYGEYALALYDEVIEIDDYDSYLEETEDDYDDDYDDDTRRLALCNYELYDSNDNLCTNNKILDICKNNLNLKLRYDIYTFTYRDSLFKDGFEIRKDSLIKYFDNDSEVVIPDYVHRIAGDAFKNKKGLSSIKIPWYVKTIDVGAFSNCSNLSNVILEDGIQEIGAYAFSGCTSLKNIIIPDSVNIIHGGVFSGCKSLTSIKFPEKFTKIPSNLFQKCDSLRDLEFLPKNITSLPSSVFQECAGLVDLKIPAGIKSLGCYAFAYCPNLKTVTLNKELTDISYDVFAFCTNLTSVIFPKETKLKTLDSGTFYKCESLTSVELPDSLTYISSGAFVQCSSLKDLYITNNVTTIEYHAFYDCPNLTIHTTNPYVIDYCKENNINVTSL